MSKKFHVTRIMSVLQGTTVKADSAELAIEASRKLLQKEWSTIDNKRRKGYKAVSVSYPC